MSLRVDDIDWARGIITIRPETTKNGRMRYIPVSSAVLHLVRRYIESNRRVLIAAYGGEDRGQIFVSESTRNPGCPLAVGAFDEIVERVREKVGLPFLTPHTLRHQRCTILKRAGISLDEIRRHYYLTHPMINPSGLVAVRPDEDFSAPHDRERVGAGVGPAAQLAQGR